MLSHHILGKGKQVGENRQAGLGTTIVMNLTGRWLQSGRNTVCDNFFTSVPLAEELLEEHTTIVGTLPKNKVELPLEMKTKQYKTGRFFCVWIRRKRNTGILRIIKGQSSSGFVNHAS